MTAPLNYVEEEEHYITSPYTFTRSNGTLLSRLYERLTKASRRQHERGWGSDEEHRMYRRGVYDAYKALQSELEE